MKKILLFTSILILLLSAPILTSAVSSMKKIATVDTSMEGNYVYPSPTGKKVGMIVLDVASNKYKVVVGNHTGKPYQYINAFIWAANGTTYYYLANDGTKNVLVSGEKEGKKYDYIDGLAVSPKGSKVAYAASIGDDHFMVFNNKESKPYKYVSYPVFCDKGSKLAYFVQESYPDGPKTLIITNGKTETKTQVADYPTSYLFSPDCKKFAYTISTFDGVQNKAYVVNGSYKSPEYYSVGGLTFSANSKKLGFMATKVDGQGQYEDTFVIDGKEGTWYSRIIFGPVFSPDGKHVAYIAQTEGDQNYGFYVDSFKGSQSQASGPIEFSRDSKMVAYTSWTDQGTAVILAEITDAGLIEKPQTFYQEVVSSGGKGGGGYYAPYEKYLIFAPDNKTLIYPARNMAEYFMVIGSKNGSIFDYVWFPIISKNKKSVGYVALQGKDVYWVEDAL